jgi:dihydrofolate reductase/thymidylate synthase
MKLNLIFAITPDKIFGIDNRLPWIHCKDDLKHFNKITTNIFNNSYIVMGRKTWESLPSNLEDRIKVVISKNKTKEGYDYKFDSLDKFFEKVNLEEISPEIFIIGGKQMIEEVLEKYRNIVHNIYISIIKKEIIDGKDKIYLNVDLSKYENFMINKIEREEVTICHYQLPEHQEIQYLNLLRKTLKGDYRSTRNSETYSIFSEKLSFDLTKGFPLLTTKKVFFRGVFEELMFFIRGQTDSKILEAKGINIWKWNTTKEFIQKCGLNYEEGDMGPLYGFNWKHFGAEYVSCKTDYTNKGFNQIEEVLNLLENDPHSRRILLTDYNPSIAKQGVLYPCHSIIIQFYICKVEEKFMVSMNMYQRSIDEFLGLPFNIASNALLLHLICNTLNIRKNSEIYFPDKLNIIMGDCHIYNSHLEAVKEQISRIPYDLPQINIKLAHKSLENYKWEDVEIQDYQSHSPIKAEMIA